MSGRRRLGPDGPRAAGASPHPEADADGVCQVIYHPIWDGPQPDHLRAVGEPSKSPSGPNSVKEQVQDYFDSMRARRDAFVAAINEQMPRGVTVSPWAKIPWSLWQRKHASFLLVICGLTPIGPWNTMLLPDSHRSAAILGLPQRMEDPPPDLEDSANRVIGHIREGFVICQERIGAAVHRGDTSGLDDYVQAKRDAAKSVMDLADVLGANTYGDEAFAHHQDIFGPMFDISDLPD